MKKLIIFLFLFLPSCSFFQKAIEHQDEIELILKIASDILEESKDEDAKKLLEKSKEAWEKADQSAAKDFYCQCKIESNAILPKWPGGCN